MTTKTIFCQKLKQDLEPLDAPPIPGPLGEKIQQSISKQAWENWLSQQTMLINEYRLNLLEKKSQEFLQQEMQKFLFEDNNQKPPGYTERS